MSFPGTYEWIIIFLVVLIFFGPKSLPKFGRALGNGLREFKAATNKVTDAINSLDETPTTPEGKSAPAPAITNVPPPVQVVEAEQIAATVEADLLVKAEEEEKSYQESSEREKSSTEQKEESLGDEKA
jgi:sec-independent protein translocase protein TatA